MPYAVLYEQAVQLNSRASRIAASLLIHETGVPANVRLALLITLSRAGDEDAEITLHAAKDRDATAAQLFVMTCLLVSRHHEIALDASEKLAAIRAIASSETDVPTLRRATGERWG
ncbi:hypothetical protein [Variovorax sp. LT1R16]|uniref:hypothetical protein n=1 Tax=Variovorax sp. LT1R16 TaxID=3443728 RepID=UPI003F45AD7F